eukprot:scaffold6057_cov66-Attheya_sp.AAC.3
MTLKHIGSKLRRLLFTFEEGRRSAAAVFEPCFVGGTRGTIVPGMKEELNNLDDHDSSSSCHRHVVFVFVSKGAVVIGLAGVFIWRKIGT